MEDFLTLAKLVLMDSSSAMTAESIDILPIAAIALILVFFRLRIVNQNPARLAKSVRAESTCSGRFLQRQRIPALKNCPNCAEELPLSAIICETCDYNFLAERPGRSQNLLPPPQEVAQPERPVYELTVLHREELRSV
jgi:hypothetical protein